MDKNFTIFCWSCGLSYKCCNNNNSPFCPKCGTKHSNPFTMTNFTPVVPPKAQENEQTEECEIVLPNDDTVDSPDERIEKLEKRIEALEAFCENMANEIVNRKDPLLKLKNDFKRVYYKNICNFDQIPRKALFDQQKLNILPEE